MGVLNIIHDIRPALKCDHLYSQSNNQKLQDIPCMFYSVFLSYRLLRGLYFLSLLRDQLKATWTTLHCLYLACSRFVST